MRRISLTVVPFAVAAAISPHPVLAATVSAPECVNQVAPLTAVGTGFAPFAPVDVRLTGVPDARVAADAAGNFAAPLTAPLFSGDATVEASDGFNVAASTLRIIKPDVAPTPQSAGIGARVRLAAQGFPTGRRVWAHVKRHNGRFLWKVRLRRAAGPCGAFTTRARLFVKRRRSVAPGSVDVIVSPSRRKARTRPYETLSFVVGTRGIPPRTYRGYALLGSSWTERTR